MDALPENVSITKQKRPKGWSYPLKTQEILDALDAVHLGKRLSIYYDNSPPYPDKRLSSIIPPDESSWHVFLMMHTGGESVASRNPPTFTFHLKLCQPRYRQPLREILKQEVLPLAQKWALSLRTASGSYDLSLQYWGRRYGNGPKLTLTDGNGKELFCKTIDLNQTPDLQLPDPQT